MTTDYTEPPVLGYFQREAGRFAAGSTRVDEIRRTTNRAAIRMLVLGRRDEALRAMYEGLKAQAPLSFKPPAVVSAIDAASGDVTALVATEVQAS